MCKKFLQATKTQKELDAIADWCKANGLKSLEAVWAKTMPFLMGFGEGENLVKNYLAWLQENNVKHSFDSRDLMFALAANELFRQGEIPVDLESVQPSHPFPLPVYDANTGNRRQWEQIRNYGIGGSDAAAVFGQSGFKSNLDLAMTKWGVLPSMEEDQNNWFTLAYGNALEGDIVKLFAERENVQTAVCPFTVQHPRYPWMLANVDFVCFRNDVMELGEIKTTSPFNRGSWDDGIPVSYQYQLAHYLTVCGRLFPTEKANICCLYGNHDTDLVIRKTDKTKLGLKLVEGEHRFWTETVLQKKKPPVNGNPETYFRTFVKYGYGSKHTTAALPTEAEEFMEAYSNAEKEIKGLKAQLKVFENQKKEAQVNLVSILGENEKGNIVMNGDTFTVSNTLTEKRTVDYDKLFSLFPDAYTTCVKSSTSHKFGIKKVK